MARRYVRDNRGRFATTGATARGGRLRTASGNKRKAQTMKAAPGEAKRGTIKRSTIKARRTEKSQTSNAAQKTQTKRQRTRRPTAAESRAKGLTPISEIKARRAAEAKASQAAGQSAYNRRYQSSRTKAAADAYRKSGVKGQKFSTIKNPAPEGSAPFKVTGSTYQGRKNAAAGRAARDAKQKRRARAKTDLQAMQQADRIMSKLAKRQKAVVDNASSLESGLRGIRRNNARASVVNRSLKSRGLLGKYNRLTAPADPIRMTPAGKGIPKPKVSSAREQATNRLKLRTAAKRRLIADRGSVIPAQPKARRIRAQRPASTVAKPRTKGNDPKTVARRVDRKAAVNQANINQIVRRERTGATQGGQYQRALKTQATLKRAQEFTKTGKLPGRDNSIRAQRERRAASQRLAAKNAERKAARQQRAQTNLARTADTRNKPGSTMIRRPSQKMTRGNLRAERALEFYKDPKKALKSVNKTRRGFRLPRSMR